LFPEIWKPNVPVFTFVGMAAIRTKKARNLSDTPEITTEQKILDAAKAVFLTKGLDGARMDEIAKEAGINKALLHYYFQSKDKLFEKIFDQIAGRFIPDVSATLHTEGSIIDKLEVLVEKYIDFVSENPKTPLLILSEINRNPERIKSLLSQTENFSKIQQLVFQLVMDMQIGKIRTFNPLHLMLNIISLCLFPFIAQPMFQAITNTSDTDFKVILSQRKEAVKSFIREALNP
jgi:AcrR family transcriptional regulator